MEVKVKINTLVIKDKETGEEYTLKTLRTAKEVADYIEETEKEEAVFIVEAAVLEACGR